MPVWSSGSGRDADNIKVVVRFHVWVRKMTKRRRENCLEIVIGILAAGVIAFAVGIIWKRKRDRKAAAKELAQKLTRARAAALAKAPVYKSSVTETRTYPRPVAQTLSKPSPRKSSPSKSSPSRSSRSGSRSTTDDSYLYGASAATYYGSSDYGSSSSSSSSSCDSSSSSSSSSSSGGDSGGGGGGGGCD